MHLVILQILEDYQLLYSPPHVHYLQVTVPQLDAHLDINSPKDIAILAQLTLPLVPLDLSLSHVILGITSVLELVSHVQEMLQLVHQLLSQPVLPGISLLPLVM